MLPGPFHKKNYITATRKIGGWAFGCNGHGKRPLLSCHSCFILLSYECTIGVWSKRQKSPNCETYGCMTSPSAVGFIERTISRSCGSDVFEFCKPYLHSPASDITLCCQRVHPRRWILHPLDRQLQHRYGCCAYCHCCLMVSFFCFLFLKHCFVFGDLMFLQLQRS